MKVKEIQGGFKNRLGYIIIAIAAIAIIFYVVFKYPGQGVADQGDFDRIMSASGLTLIDSDKNNLDFIRFYKYIVTDYSISSNFLSFLHSFLGTSVVYLIRVVNFVVVIFGGDVFKTQYLAIAYGTMYIFGFLYILKNLNIKSRSKFIVLGCLILLVFFDGNYLIWFNSLYGEPMMVTTCILLIGAVLNYMNKRYLRDEKKEIIMDIVYVFITTFLFLISKMQVITAIPFVLVMSIKILWDNRRYLSKNKLIELSVLIAFVVIFPFVINKTNGDISNDTQYNSVFYGVLNESKTPEQDLRDMGLNPDMAVEAGKHAYLEPNEYVKYAPRTEITEQEFYSKMSNGKLAKFYLTHPLRLIQGMEYTAEKAYITSTSLGKTYRFYSEESVTEFNRFVTWSVFREKYIPKKIWFIASVYLVMFSISLFYFIKDKGDKVQRLRIMLLWCIMLIGAIQFPMPFVGNGRADTAKQLFLFNFVFDIMIVTSLSWTLFKIIDILKINDLFKKNSTKDVRMWLK